MRRIEGQAISQKGNLKKENNKIKQETNQKLHMKKMTPKSTYTNPKIQITPPKKIKKIHNTIFYFPS